MHISLDEYILARTGDWSLEEFEKISAVMNITIGQIFKILIYRDVIMFNDPLKSKIQKEYIEKYHATATTADMAQMFGIKSARICKLCTKINIKLLSAKNSADGIRAFILANYETKTPKEIAADKKVTVFRIYELMGELGISKYKKKISKIDTHKKFILENYSTLTKTDIAKELGLTENYINFLCDVLKVHPVTHAQKMELINMKFIRENRKVKTDVEICAALEISDNHLRKLLRLLNFETYTSFDKRNADYISFIKKYNQTKSIEEIADLLGLSMNHIRSIFKNANLSWITDLKKRTPAMKEYIIIRPSHKAFHLAKRLDTTIYYVNLLRKQIKREKEFAKKLKKEKIEQYLHKPKPKPKIEPEIIPVKVKTKMKQNELLKFASRLKFNFDIDSGSILTKSSR